MSKKPMPPKKDYLANIAFGTSDHIPRVIELSLANITPDPDQPRKFFDETELNSLASSIREKGLLQPIIVRTNPDREGAYIIVAGERRYRASTLAGLPSIGCIVTQGDPAELALIENVQRVDLNPIEEAEAIERLMQSHNYTHDAVAGILGKSRVAVTETLSILKLPANIREKMKSLDVKRSALRQLVRMDDQTQAEAVARIEAGETLTARDAEALKKKVEPTPAKLAIRALYASIERLSQILEKPKSDEWKALQSAKKALDERYKSITGLK